MNIEPYWWNPFKSIWKKGQKIHKLVKAVTVGKNKWVKGQTDAMLVVYSDKNDIISVLCTGLS